MDVDKSLMTGTTTLLVLSLLRDGENYGYGIISELARRSDETFLLKEGTLYPILHGLENNKCVEMCIRDSYRGVDSLPHRSSACYWPHRMAVNCSTRAYNAVFAQIADYCRDYSMRNPSAGHGEDRFDVQPFAQQMMAYLEITLFKEGELTKRAWVDDYVCTGQPGQFP